MSDRHAPNLTLIREASATQNHLFLFPTVMRVKISSVSDLLIPCTDELRVVFGAGICRTLFFNLCFWKNRIQLNSD